MCQNLKDAMENEECECDKAPEAFTSDTFCDDKADAYHEKHKKEDFLQVRNSTKKQVAIAPHKGESPVDPMK